MILFVSNKHTLSFFSASMKIMLTLGLPNILQSCFNVMQNSMSIHEIHSDSGKEWQTVQLQPCLLWLQILHLFSLTVIQQMKFKYLPSYSRICMNWSQPTIHSFIYFPQLMFHEIWFFAKNYLRYSHFTCHLSSSFILWCNEIKYFCCFAFLHVCLHLHCSQYIIFLSTWEIIPISNYWTTW